MKLGTRLLLTLSAAVTLIAGHARAQCPSPLGFPFVVTPVSSTKADLFWQVPSGSNPGLYQLYRGTSPANLAQIATLSAPFYTDRRLAPATQYYYAVEASSNGSKQSSIACVITPALPSPPANLAASSARTAITLTWEGSLTSESLAIAKFKLFRGTTPGNFAEIAAVKALSYTDTSVAPGTTYYYALETVDAFGQLSPLSALVQATTPD